MFDGASNVDKLNGDCELLFQVFFIIFIGNRNEIFFTNFLFKSKKYFSVFFEYFVDCMNCST